MVINKQKIKKNKTKKNKTKKKTGQSLVIVATQHGDKIK